jgi:glycosyltransferase involved in cell wall biosynthesis/predicted metal-dependent phosphoesterase TrpH
MRTTAPTTRTDMHCHSTASERSRLGVQRALGLPECATPPEEAYQLAKRRGMDFFTLTDHDTIEGALELADRPDCFVSEELTAWFANEPQAVHVLCFGITPDDHGWLAAHRRDLETCAAYLEEHEIACALAHPFYSVAAPLGRRHRRRLAELFGVWETRNGSRARELNMPAEVYIETHGGTGIGGSDDHAGVDIGRTFTETPPAVTPEEFLCHVREGLAEPGGEQGSAAKWAHAAIALALRAVGRGSGPPPDPAAVLTIAERVIREGHARQGAAGSGLGPDHARALLRAWLDACGLELEEGGLIAYMQEDGFSHADLYRRARRAHERALRRAVHAAVSAVGSTAEASTSEVQRAARGLFEACIPAIPYAPATAFLAREKGRLVHHDREPLRVALVVDAVGGMHGVTHTLDEIRERGVPGFEVEVIGTDATVDRRLAAIPDVEIPFYEGLKIGVPSLPAVVETLAEGRYDLIHLCSPGPAGAGAALLARVMDLPTVGSYHTELATYAGLRTGAAELEAHMRLLLAVFYGRCDVVLSPSPSADESLADLGVARERIGRWDRGVDESRFSPAHRVEGLHPGAVNVLYAGRLTVEKGIDLLADSFEEARRHDERLHLVLAGGGPEQERLRERLDEHATFLGWLEGEELARAYASADLFLFASRTDTFGQVILEAQASGLPVVAVDEGGPASLVADGATGRLCPAEARALAQAVIELAGDPQERQRLARAALSAVGRRGWDRSLSQLAAGYRRAAVPRRTRGGVRRAA